MTTWQTVDETSRMRASEPSGDEPNQGRMKVAAWTAFTREAAQPYAPQAGPWGEADAATAPQGIVSGADASLPAGEWSEPA
jgi:hypothetical protein